MNAGAKLGAYGLVLAAALGGGAAVGGAAGPIDVDDAPAHDQHDGEPMSPGDEHEPDATTPDATTPDATTPDATTPDVGGLAVAQSGFRFVSEDRLADAGEFAFVIEGPDGEAITAFDVEHTKRLHLVVASRDLQQFAHVHPDLDDNGRWTADLPDLPAGPYRAFADFHPTGSDAVTLGIDLTAPGSLTTPGPLDTIATDEVDGYDVRLDGDPRAGESSTLSVTVARDGSTVTTDPYLGARGHLVALRDGDLAYLHVHPMEDESSDAVRFMVEVPSPGTYALFFDFSHDGSVHTARFVVDTTETRSPDQPTSQPTTDDADGDAGHGHD